MCQETCQYVCADDAQFLRRKPAICSSAMNYNMTSSSRLRPLSTLRDGRVQTVDPIFKSTLKNQALET